MQPAAPISPAPEFKSSINAPNFNDTLRTAGDKQSSPATHIRKATLSSSQSNPRFSTAAVWLLIAADALAQIAKTIGEQG